MNLNDITFSWYKKLQRFENHNQFQFVWILYPVLPDWVQKHFIKILFERKTNYINRRVPKFGLKPYM